MKRLIKLMLTLCCIAALHSCSYGFFNFSDETGSLELNLEFVNINALNVDKVTYELTPPKGFNSTLSGDISGSWNYKSLDRMDTGAWSVKGGFYADGELVQEFSYGIEILAKTRTRLRIEAQWFVSEYEISFQSWQEPEDDNGSADNDTAAEPSFALSEIRLIPAYFISNENEEFYTVNVCILGSNLDSDVQGLKLIYPDGYSYEYGYNYEYSRSVLMLHQSSYSRIEILRNQLIPGSGPDGNYRLRLSDYNGVASEYSEALSSDYKAGTPVITGYNANSIVPATIYSSGPHDFGYEFNSTAGIGSRLVFLINRSTNTIEPSDDSMAVGTDVGTLNISGALPSGNYEFIAAAVGYSTVTPVSDAAVFGISPDGLKSENLTASIYQIYGENTGYVSYRAVSFIVP